MSSPGTPNTDYQPLSFDQAIQFYWGAPNDGGSPILDYRLILAYSGGSLVYTPAAADVTFIATGLTNNVTYSATLEARNANGYSAIPGTYRDWQPGIGIPGAPSTVTATLVGATNAILSWTPPAVSPTAPIYWYVIEAYSTSNPLPIASYSANGLTQSNYFITGLNSNLAYYFNVSAVNYPDYSLAVRTSTIQYLVPFQPNYLPGMSMWLDGRDPLNTGTAPANGTSITTWFDKSGQGYNATSAGTGGVPTYSSAEQTVNVFSSNSFYTTTYSASLSNESIFFVFKMTNANQTSLLGPASPTTGGRAVYVWTVPMWLEAGLASVGGYTTTTSNSVTYCNMLLGSLTINNNTWSAFINSGNQRLSATSGNPTAGKTTNLGYFQYTYELNIYNRPLTPFDSQKVEGYLAWKWGIQSNLPTSHPFRTAAPYSNSVFAPTSFTNLQFWLDASQLTGFTNGQALTTWVDKSSNAYSGTATGGPTYQTNVINSLPIVRFNGTSQYVNFGNVLNMGVSSLNMFAVYKQNISTSPTAVFGKTSYRGNAGRWGLARDTTTFFLFEGSSGGTTAGYSDSSTSFQINSGGWDRTTITIFQNGTSAGTASLVNSANLSNSDPLVVGAYPNSDGGFPPQFFMNGDIAELLVYNRALSTPDRQTVEGYLAWKWGLQGSLPTTHPYVLNNPGVVSTTLSVATTSLLLRFDALTYIVNNQWINTGSLGTGFNATIETGIPTKNIAGNGVVFNGSTNFTFPNPSLGNSWTAMIWYKRTGNPTGENAAIVCENWTGGSINMFVVANFSSSGSSNVTGGFFRGGYFSGGAVQFNLNEWHSITVSWDGISIRTYFDGILRNTTGYSTTSLNGGNAYRIGREWNYLTPDYIVGEVGQILIYNRALSATEVLQNYAATSNTFSV